MFDVFNPTTEQENLSFACSSLCIGFSTAKAKDFVQGLFPHLQTGDGKPVSNIHIENVRMNESRLEVKEVNVG